VPPRARAGDDPLCYDALDRLTHVWAEGDDPAPYDRSYAYDLVGNITSRGTVSYTYGSAAHIHAVTSLTDGSSYTYDANGNMITRVEGGVTYQQVFDVENQLVSVTAGGQTTSFVCDRAGNGATAYYTVTRDVLAPTAAITVPQGATTADVGQRRARSRSAGWLRTLVRAWPATTWPTRSTMAAGCRDTRPRSRPRPRSPRRWATATPSGCGPRTT